MTKFKKQIFAVLTAGAVLINSSSFAFAATDITISGNGADTDNTAHVSLDNSTNVVQSNTANVSNNVNVNSNTGDNQANDNGGGSVSIDTQDATAHVTVSNDLNSNAASVDCCPNGNTDVKISDNLRDSDNKVDLSQKNETGLFQTNDAYVKNSVDTSANTGYNKANDNIGGNVSITTGATDAHVDVTTVANRNIALVGGNPGDGTGVVSAWIVGNGADSDNNIKLHLNRDLSLLQDNMAYINNDVNVDGNTGHNKASDNGGNVKIETGDANADVIVDNLVNFNAAAVDCGCLLDVKAKIGENLKDSDNTIRAYLSDDKEVFQTNWADLYNDPYVDGNTGYNKAKDNLSGHGDPSIKTGPSDTDVKVKNSGNENTYGVSLDLPESLSDTNVSFSFDLSLLRALLGFT